MTGTIISAAAIVVAIIYAWWSNRTPPVDGFKQGEKQDRRSVGNPRLPRMQNPPPPPPQRPPSKPDKY